MRWTIKTLGFAALAVVVAGCTSRDHYMPGFGDSVRHNIAVQTIDPDPPYADEPTVHDARQVIDAYGRYRTGKVKQPSPIGTSGGTGG